MHNKNNNTDGHIPFLKTDVYKNSTDADFMSNLNDNLENTIVGDDFSNVTETIYENPHPRENLKNTLVDSLNSTNEGQKALKNTSSSKSDVPLSTISTISNRLR
ncbi:hypothetical protein [Clostridium taeniosporum]|uniref:Uncharacterized protein n=1 Tax=Clostridium taeniosporum TaxID=394958 RepID=A0A1D7XK85_9CLOT|nr:hypothetical protein [Clostridium taeniosporum]AOR23509.1 hypothetical protein BGI42_07070 [Clostridium taeniosporum]